MFSTFRTKYFMTVLAEKIMKKLPYTFFIIDYENDWPARLESSKYTLKQLDTWMESANCHREATYHFLEGNFFVIYRFEPLGR